MKNGLRGSKQASKNIVISFIVFLIFISPYIWYRYHFGFFRIPTDTMCPAICKGEKIAINKKAYADKLPERGDIIIFKYMDKGKKKVYVKRVGGLPGEKLEIKNGKVHINNEVVNADNLPSNIYYMNAGKYGDMGKAIIIPADSYYVLGDKSEESLDSRYFGPINKKDIYGKFIFKYKSGAELMRMLFSQTP